MRRYIWDRKTDTIKAEENILLWGEWFETSDRSLAKDRIGEILISTVFLGLDHSFSDRATPVLWETMIFGGKHDQHQVRATSKEEALRNHQDCIDLVNSSVEEDHGKEETDQ